jgi:hypothetical protein
MGKLTVSRAPVVIISCSFATEKSADCYRAGGWCAGGFTDHMNLQTATSGGSRVLEASLTICLFVLVYQPSVSNTFLSEQISHQQPSSSTFISEQISTSHQPSAKRTGSMLIE